MRPTTETDRLDWLENHKGNPMTDAITRYENRGLDKLLGAIDAHPEPASPRPWRMDRYGTSGDRKVCRLIDARGMVLAIGMWEEDAKLILAAVSAHDSAAHDAMAESDR